MAEVEHEYLDTDTAVSVAKAALDITTPNSLMVEEEVREVCRWIGENAPDTITVDGRKVFRRMGIEAMLFIALTEFPWFYEKFELTQFN